MSNLNLLLVNSPLDSMKFQEGDPFIMPTAQRILVVDDDQNIRRLISHTLEGAGYLVDQAEDGQQAVELATKLSSENIAYDAALIDLQMPRLSGSETLLHFKQNFPSTQCLMVSAVGKIQDAVSAMSNGAYWYIQKPFDPDELLSLTARALELGNLKEENRSLKQTISQSAVPANFIGTAKSTDQIREQIKKIAPLDSTILLTGPSGTGKSTLARLIHQSGPRANEPFVAISCAALPRDLLEAELFGHEKGSFTGATSSRPGKIEVANGGTLFLDEIGDMPLDLQPKLLTFLQDRVFQRIGSNKDQKVDVRIVAATHKDLSQMVEDQTFRQDLYYRINVLSIDIPGLAFRPEDVTPLAIEILSRISSRRNCEPFEIEPEALKVLRAHPWPGNVRELENVLERATAFCLENKILKEDLNIEASNQAAPTDLAGLSLEEIERRAIVDTLDFCQGNKSDAATMLGISQKSIYNKINKYDIKL